MRIIALYLVFLSACSVARNEKPIHPLETEGFPGAPIEPGLFPLEPGLKWVYLATDGRRLELSIQRDGDRLRLTGTKEGGAEIREQNGFIEVVHEGKVIDRPFKLNGKAGDTWRLGKARYTVFGYDRIEVLGHERRALVVAVERGPIRDLYWFAEGLGCVRIRTENEGAMRRDAILVEFASGTN